MASTRITAPNKKLIKDHDKSNTILKKTFPSLHERIREMSQIELEALAACEALAMADSSKLEGLVLDQERIRIELLSGYQLIQATKSQTN